MTEAAVCDLQLRPVKEDHSPFRLGRYIEAPNAVKEKIAWKYAENSAAVRRIVNIRQNGLLDTDIRCAKIKRRASVDVIAVNAGG
jgi:hypothetical protein